MDFNLTPEQKMIQEMARDFTEKNIKPVVGGQQPGTGGRRQVPSAKCQAPSD
jgi:hypothetical protein